MQRREFVAGLVGAAAWRRPARAQQRERVRRIGALMGWSDTNPEARSWFAFVQGLAQFGWVDGGNVRIEQWWLNADIDRAGALAKELVAQQPDVIVTGSTPATAALHGRPAPSRSCSRSSTTRWARVSSPACRAPAATLRGS